jgi:hypothetical protein
VIGDSTARTVDQSHLLILSLSSPQHLVLWSIWPNLYCPIGHMKEREQRQVDMVRDRSLVILFLPVADSLQRTEFKGRPQRSCLFYRRLVNQNRRPYHVLYATA